MHIETKKTIHTVQGKSGDTPAKKSRWKCIKKKEVVNPTKCCKKQTKIRREEIPYDMTIIEFFAIFTEEFHCNGEDCNHSVEG